MIRPPLSTCLVLSPFEIAKIIPFAITTGSGTDMFLEIQAGTSAGLPSTTSTLNAITLPSGASPFSIGNLGPVDAGGPEAGAYSQRVPDASSHVESAPQNPRPMKFTSSLAYSGLRNSGVRWSAPPI